MVFFSDIFAIDPVVLKQYGALDISVVNDLPLFIDPFLLFGSDKKEYQQLHKNILDYVSFLRSKSHSVNAGELSAWFMFPEVKQNWLGYSKVGNDGRGLGRDFANNFSKSLNLIFSEESENISAERHIEKVGLFQTGIGRDNISDFTTNLILEYLLEYTQHFALKYLNESQRRQIKIGKVRFDYHLERWSPKTFIVPFFDGDYILLTPRDILTKDDTWINRADLNDSYEDTINIIDNSRLRAEINNYFSKSLPPPRFTKKNVAKKRTKKERNEAIAKVLGKYPQILDFYIKLKEIRKRSAKATSVTNVTEIEKVFVEAVTSLLGILAENTDFFASKSAGDSFTASLKRITFLKQVIENNDGYKIFYHKGEPIKREADLQVIFRLTWFSTKYDVNSEVNNGRGPVDYKVSKGSKDSTLVEFKLASNSQIEQNLENQVKVYSQANSTRKTIKVILYFDSIELQKVQNILSRLKIENDESIVLINAGRTGKESASKVKTPRN